MKLEKLNDNQIRCTLNQEDLQERQLHISELAYGTDRAKALFRDMMQQAFLEFGFEAENIPLMIEATPLSGDSLVLVITKLEDPDELDTRFSRFTQQDGLEVGEDSSYADEVIHVFEQIGKIIGAIKDQREMRDALPDHASSDEGETKEGDLPEAKLTRMYAFHSLAEITQLASLLVHSFEGSSSVYKMSSSLYYLVISQGEQTPEEFTKICDIIAEYGAAAPVSYASVDYLQEHGEVIVREKAIPILSVM